MLEKFFFAIFLSTIVIFSLSFNDILSLKTNSFESIGLISWFSEAFDYQQNFFRWRSNSTRGNRDTHNFFFCLAYLWRFSSLLLFKYWSATYDLFIIPLYPWCTFFYCELTYPEYFEKFSLWLDFGKCTSEITVGKMFMFSRTYNFGWSSRKVEILPFYEG